MAKTAQNTLFQLFRLPLLLECLLFGAFYFYTTLFTTMFNSLQPVLEPLFSKQEIGIFLAILFFSAAIAILPGSILLDKIQLKKLELLVMSIYTIGVAVLLLILPDAFVIRINFFIMGLCGALSFNCAIKYAELRAPKRKFVFTIGLLSMIGNVVCILAQAPILMLSDSVGLKGVLLTLVLLGVSILLLIQIFVTPVTPPLSRKRLLSKVSLSDYRKKLREFVAKRKNWCGVFYISATNLPPLVLGGAWNNVYLTHAHNLNPMQASAVTTILYIGIIVGAPLTGWICDTFIIRKPLLLETGSIGLLVTALTIIYVDSSFTILLILYFFFGIFSGTQPAAYSLLRKINSGLSGIVLGLIAMASAIVTGLCMYLFSYLADMPPVAGVAANYQIPMLIFPVAFLLTVLSVLLLRSEK
jgi:MFS family permease